MSLIVTTISKRNLQNTFVKEVILVTDEVLGKVILDSLLLAYLSMLDVLLVPSTDARFPIIILPILPISWPTDYI